MSSVTLLTLTGLVSYYLGTLLYLDFSDKNVHMDKLRLLVKIFHSTSLSVQLNFVYRTTQQYLLDSIYDLFSYLLLKLEFFI